MKVYDALSYSMPSLPRKALATVSSLPAIVSVMLIRIYQHTLSPDHGPIRHFFRYGCCRHDPTCSMFAIEALKTQSFPIALFLIAKRILGCHPWKEVSDEKMKTVVAREME